MTSTDTALQAAWRAYYETLRDHPMASTEQRERAQLMLDKKRLYPLATEPEEFV